MSRLLGGLLAVALLATACSGSSAAERTSGGALEVVAVENVWGDVLRQIGGTHVAVTSILTNPSSDPHTFETDVRAAAVLSGAAFVVVNGLGYDDFASKLLSAGGARGRTVLTVATAVGASGEDANPHLWYSSRYVQSAAAAFAAQLSDLDPAHAPSYRAGLAAFLKAYQPYVDAVAALKRSFAGTRVAYTERVAGYLVEDAGLVLGIPVSFPRAIEDGNDPSLSDVDAVTTALSHRTVKALLFNSQVTSPVTDTLTRLATSRGVPVVAVAETLPSDQPDVQTWQLAQARALAKALAS